MAKAKIHANVNCDAVVATVKPEAVLASVGSVRTVTAKQLLAAMDKWPVLTKTEAIVLDELATFKGRPVLHPDMLDAVYGHRADGGPATGDAVIKVIVHRVRQKAKANIVTSHGIGYALIPRVETEVSSSLTSQGW